MDIGFTEACLDFEVDVGRIYANFPDGLSIAIQMREGKLEKPICAFVESIVGIRIAIRIMSIETRVKSRVRFDVPTL